MVNHEYTPPPGLNAAQAEALTHGTGPAMVLAGPGSGKTTVLTGRIKYLIEALGIPPSRILVITFTKAAALSMQVRFGRECGSAPVNFGTYHAVFYHILKQHYHFSDNCIASFQERYHILERILHDESLDGATRAETRNIIESVMDCMGLRKNGAAESSLTLPDNVDMETFNRICRAYKARLKGMGLIEFDDMLCDSLELFLHRPDVLDRWRARFSYILVDEFQDSNMVQYRLLRLLAAPANNLFVVGDDDQSIYGFRGAAPGLMRQFAQDYPEAHVVVLDTNYRSVPAVVEASNSVIYCNTDRLDKSMKAARLPDASVDTPVTLKYFADSMEEYDWIAARLSALHEGNHSYADMAVLTRTNREISLILPHLKRRDIPAIVQEQVSCPYAHPIVQDVIAYLRFAAGEHSRELFLKICNKPARYISRDVLWDQTVNLQTVAAEYTRLGKGTMAESVQRLDRLFTQMRGLTPYLAISMIRKLAGYDSYLISHAAGNEETLTEWQELLDSVQDEARVFDDIPTFLCYADDEVNNAEASSRRKTTQPKEGVQLMTIHASKGLEYPYVAITGVNEGNIPHGRMLTDAQLEEERRLFYVAMTRAKDMLDILYLKGGEMKRQPSQFLKPLEDYSISSNSMSSSHSSKASSAISNSSSSSISARLILPSESSE